MVSVGTSGSIASIPLYATLTIVASSALSKPLFTAPRLVSLQINEGWVQTMTVLVTGGAGYIGSHMVHALAEAGESVVVIDNLSTGFSSVVPEGVPLFIGDAGDENLVEGVISQHGVESIIHFAGSVVVPESMRDPLAYYRNNTMTTRSLLNAAVKRGVNRFIFSSTAAVYGNPDQVPVPETAPTRPLSPYGSSKLMTEIMLHDVAAAHGMQLRGAALFQRCWRRSAGAHRARHRRRDASAQDRGGSRDRTARQDRRVRHRLSDAGRQLHPRLHPCRDLAQAHRSALAYLRDGGGSIDAELRLWPRLFGAGDDRSGAARLGPQIRGPVSRRAGPATS